MRNLIDAMLLSTEEIGDTNIVRLIANVTSPADSISVKPIGFKGFISALRKIGLESNYVINQKKKDF